MGKRAGAVADPNARIAALLRDLASVQTARQSEWGYKRAAAAVLALDRPLDEMLDAAGRLPRIPSIGPSSLRVVMEALATGASPTVERAIEASGRAADVARRRALRDHFFSRAAVAAILADGRLRGLRRDAYLGDLQMHTVWSDGSQSLRDVVTGCLARGYVYAAVTDHSYGLPIAGGMSMEEAARQHREIDALNREYRGRFRLIKGVEANIAADGALDIAPDEIRRFELVVAAPHSKLRIADDQTHRLMRAVTTPGVHILGHPRGRMYGSRAGVSADWPRIFRAAAASGVAIEIDGDPSRQDLDWTLASRAREAGCLFALDSDAHATAELAYAETAIAHARLAGLSADRVINCWAVDRLRAWLDARRNA